MSSLVLSLRPGVSVTSRADELEFVGQATRIAFKRVSPAVRGALEQLANAGVPEDHLTDAVIQAEGADHVLLSATPLPSRHPVAIRAARRGIIG